MRKKIKVALVGNPNCGKSSLFNALTGLRQKIGNYPGVTVDKKTGFFKISSNKEAELIDLPGTYSLYPKSQDEGIVYNILLDRSHFDHPDVVVIVADASNLKRNLLLASQIIDLNIPVILALNMVDVADKEGIHIKVKALQEELGISVVPINARKNKGVHLVKNALKENIAPGTKPFIKFEELAPGFFEKGHRLLPGESNYALIHFATNYKKLYSLQNVKLVKARELGKDFSFDASKFQGEETLKRYARINTILQKSVTYPETQARNLTSKLDGFVTHKYWGYLIFVAVLFIVFQSVFAFAEYPMNWVEAATSWISEVVFNLMPAAWYTDLLVDGIIAGISGVVVFIPQIAILFGFLTILEDTGYMARISYLTDRLMRSVGLNGKSVIPLMSGLACAIPAIMATRNIDNWKDRMITILVTPFMSCAARLPVYTLLIALVVPNNQILGIFNLKGLVLLGMYFLGIFMALFVAWILNFIIKGREAGYFIMELPIYRMPRWKNILVTMYERAKIFTVEAGKIILIISIILWFLASYGPGDFRGDRNMAQMETTTIENEDVEDATVQLHQSFAGKFGKFIEPAIEPLGFDWKMGIALITSFAAREVFVGTMATIYSVEADEENFESVRERMVADRDPESGRRIYTLASGLSLMIFFAFAMQCMSTLAVVRRETKSWKWPAIQLVYMTAIAYIASFATFQLLS